MRVWVTRAEPGASATAGRLRALGHEAVVAPLLEIRALAPALDFDGVAALAFTSRNGVRAFAALSDRRDLPVHAVGDATAEAAREAGFARVQSADGAVQDLADRIAADPPPGVVLWAGAQAPAGDLRGALAARGVTVRAVAVYQALTLTQPAAVAALASGAVDAVLIHSPRAAEALAAEWATASPDAGIPARAVAISGAAAAPLRRLGFRSIAVPAHPDEASLLAALGKPGPRV